MPEINRTPDKPQSFGYKISWLAVKTTEPAAVIDTLGLVEATPANWASGLAAVYETSPEGCWTFVSPPVDGWIFVVSRALPYPTVETQHNTGKDFDELFGGLMKRFEDVQFFGSYRVSGFCAWARALGGKLVRAYSYGDELMMNFGDQTAEEADLGLVDLSGLSVFDAEAKLSSIAEVQMEDQEQPDAHGRLFPDEADVVELASFWSIDPTQLSEQDHPVGLGLVARLPEPPRR